MNHQIKNILKRIKEKDPTQKEKQDFSALFHAEQLEYELKEVLFDELDEFKVEEFDASFYNSVFKKIWWKINKNKDYEKHQKNFIYPLLRIAAVLVIGLILGVSITTLINKKEPVYYSAISPCGSVSKTILPDSTIIYLNAGSEIKYTIESKDGNREVFLNGEAWFDVQKNIKNPFIVHTPFYDVNVTGTQFNIKAYETDTEIATTLEEGQIILSSSGNYKLGEKVVLSPGDQAVLNKESKELTIKKVNPVWYSSWKDNKLIFVNMELKELIVLLERKYGVEIDVIDDSILDYHYDGTIKNESILEILEIIKETLPINFKIVGQKIEITAN